MINVITRLKQLNKKQLQKICVILNKKYKKNDTKKDIILLLCTPFRTKYKMEQSRISVIYTNFHHGRGHVGVGVVPTKENPGTWGYCTNGYTFSSEPFGKGADGWVYQATKDGKTYAIKVVNLSSTITEKDVQITRVEANRNFINEIELGRLAGTKRLAPRIYDAWICKYGIGSLTSLPINSKPGEQSILSYNKCTDEYPPFDPFGTNCKNVDAGFVVMKRMKTTFEDYLETLRSTRKWVEMAHLLQRTLGILHASIWSLGIYAYDAHLGNWLINSKGELFMSDFGRTLRISEYFKADIAKIAVGRKVVLFSDVDHQYESGLSGKVGIVVAVTADKSVKMVKRLNDKKERVVQCPATNIFPFDLMGDTVFKLYSSIIKSSICGSYSSDFMNDDDPFTLLCHIFQDTGSMLALSGGDEIKYLNRLNFIFRHWQVGWTSSRAYEIMRADRGRDGEDISDSDKEDISDITNWKKYVKTFFNIHDHKKK